MNHRERALRTSFGTCCRPIARSLINLATEMLKQTMYCA